ncbi:NACHT domain-containing protein, partial [Micromonospora sp. NPDC005087]|uniref:NACHT domain-containing protein n=1 Tax=Micromonospora sp. NPDC005087 TaxID=3364225 RepID=UPI0036BE3773
HSGLTAVITCTPGILPDRPQQTDARVTRHPLDRHLRRCDEERVVRSGLSAAGTALYDLLLRECSAYIIEMIHALPMGAGSVAFAELLRRERQVLEDVRAVLERLPARRGVSDFERDYRQLVANRMDTIEFYGATVSESSRHYPLSVAYLNLSVSGELRLQRTTAQRVVTHDGQPSAGPATARVDDVLAASRRLFVRGQAGLGKTTLLQWIAVNSARRTFGEQLRDWNECVPFFVPLRRHASVDLPAPEDFLSEVGRHISAEKPPGWVHEQLRSGRAVVLIDGVDELAESRRLEARRWLRDLVAAFPLAQFVVTSRPAAAPAEWLGREAFDVAELEPMSRTDIAVFIARWHEAMRHQTTRRDDHAELTYYEGRLAGSLTEQRHLRQMASYPLLCALLCALHRDRRGDLPRSRMEIYEVALHMLLERRDSERRVGTPGLSRTDKTLLLRDIAYWLIRNERSSAPAERIRSRIATKLKSMTQIGSSADEVYRLLLERSGLLREAVEGEMDFVHRSFQEYLAAAEAVATDDIGALVSHAYTDFWSEVVVMAAGHASVTQRSELLQGLLDPQRQRTVLRDQPCAAARRRGLSGNLARASTASSAEPEEGHCRPTTAQDYGRSPTPVPYRYVHPRPTGTVPTQERRRGCRHHSRRRRDRRPRRTCSAGPFRPRHPQGGASRTLACVAPLRCRRIRTEGLG